ncbi:MAG: ABC transporter substrate-binding protein [Thermoplasmatales archaeon]|nr:ABC transporter substrate-binding protein [Candidatus Thermoplasmatota archaeon]MCL6002991.1 ABC transporter substrate-binding protein [Candidatus Thermoplasmatota archaeon]MDA8054493.1 ABC transporter substrate-binding protein [Thermoplasmatales archaeon]
MTRHNTFHRKFVMVSVILIGAIITLGSSMQIIANSTANSPEPLAASGNVTFTAGWTGTFIDSLNPFTSYSQLTYWINSNLYLRLVNFDTQNNSLQPGLSNSWSINYANHSAIFHINPNAVWSDGQPVTAQDVIYSLHLAGQPWSFVASYVTAITNTTALNNKTVMITFNGTLWQMFAAYIFIVPYHIWANVNASTYPGFNKNGSTYFVGDGPYILTNYVPNQYAEVQKNPRWFITTEIPKINTVIFQEYSSTSSAISSLQSGAIQGLTGILPANVPQFLNNSAYYVSKSPALEYQYLSIDVEKGSQGNPTLRNVTVRQAIAHAINLTYIAKTVYHGYATPLASVLVPTNQYYDTNLTPYSYNVTLANNMLTAAGFTMGSNGVRVSPNGTALSYTMLCNSADTLATSMAELIASNLTAIGIKVTVNAETTGSMASTIWLSNGTLGQDMDLWDWFDDTPFAPQLLSVFLSDQVVTGTSDSGFNNSTYDHLWSQLLSSSTPAETRAISNEMQQILHSQLPYIPLITVSSINVWSSAFKDINSSALGGPFGGFDYLTFITATPTTTTTTTPTNPYLGYEITIAVIAIIVVAVAAVYLMRSRGKKEAPPKS